MNHVRLNIGCGQTPTEGWENFDNTPSIGLARSPLKLFLLQSLRMLNDKQIENIEWHKKHNIRFADATKKIPYADASVDIIYSSHMLEHLSREGAQAFLVESLRVLRKGGVLRVAVPDLQKYIDQYQKDKNADHFMETTYVTAPPLKTFKDKLKLLFVGYRHHQWMYDGASLAKLLAHVGFENVLVQPAGQTFMGHYGQLDLREREEDSVYVEATKP